MTKTQAHVPTPNGAKYITQLLKHWSHKEDLTIDLGDGEGTVRFPSATARFTADAETLHIDVEADDAPTAARMADVIAKHIDRFAFKEAPLDYGWKKAG